MPSYLYVFKCLNVSPPDPHHKKCVIYEDVYGSIYTPLWQAADSGRRPYKSALCLPIKRAKNYYHCGVI